MRISSQKILLDLQWEENFEEEEIQGEATELPSSDVEAFSEYCFVVSKQLSFFLRFSKGESINFRFLKRKVPS